MLILVNLGVLMLTSQESWCSHDDVIMELHFPANFGNAEMYNLKNKMTILVKSCYSPSLGGQPMLTLVVCIILPVRLTCLEGQ